MASGRTLESQVALGARGLRRPPYLPRLSVTYREAKLYGFTLTEVYAMTRRHPETVSAWIRKKKIDAHKIDGEWRVSPSEIERIRHWRKT